MDPTEDEANAITDLAKAFDWAGVSADVRTTLGAALGGPTLIRDIAFIPRGDWDNVITRLKGLGAAVGDGDPPERELTVVDKSRLESFEECASGEWVPPLTHQVLQHLRHQLQLGVHQLRWRPTHPLVS